jgi:hypothetical protein
MSHSSLLNSSYLSTEAVGMHDGLRMICNPIPLFHIFGLATGILIVCSIWNAHEYLQKIKEY